MSEIMVETNRELFATDTHGPLSGKLRWAIARAVANVLPADVTDGHDHAHWQNDAQPDKIIPYADLKMAGLEFVVIKATEGKTITDAFWEQNWKQAVAGGLYVCAYHFFRANVSGVEQANHFLQATAELRTIVNYSPILFVDVETQDGVTKSVRTNRMLAMLSSLAGAGVSTGIYTSPGFWNQHIDYNNLTALLPQLNNWVAHWTGASAPLLPQKWTTAGTKFWQRGISGVHSWVPAVPAPMKGTVDYNLFFGSVLDLRVVLKVQEWGLEEKVDALWAAHPELHP